MSSNGGQRLKLTMNTMCANMSVVISTTQAVLEFVNKLNDKPVDETAANDLFTVVSNMEAAIVEAKASIQAAKDLNSTSPIIISLIGIAENTINAFSAVIESIVNESTSAEGLSSTTLNNLANFMGRLCDDTSLSPALMDK